MDKKEMTSVVMAATNAAIGRYISAAVHGLRSWKIISGIAIAVVICIIILAAIIVSLPGMIMQSMLPGNSSHDWQTQLYSFAQGEVQATETKKKNFIVEFLKALSSKDESAKLMGDEPSKEEILMIYTVKYGGHFDENKLQEKRIQEITKSFLEADGFDVLVKPFEQVVTEHGLSEEQISIALNMYSSYMYDQVMPGSGSLNIGDLGSVTYKNGSTDVVYYSQRDQRWAAESYGDGTVGKAGCGPSCLAIVVSSLTEKQVNPKQMCEWAYKKGYKSPGGGSYWKLIPEGAEHFGLKVEGSLTKKQQIVDALSEEKLVISIMGPGHFTSSGHFIVLRGVTADGKIMVADPYSQKNTEQLWDLDTIVKETKKGTAAGGPFWIISKEEGALDGK